MQDEVRVTVVATGLNRGAVRQTVRSSEREPVIQQRPVKLVRNATTGAIENPGDFNPGLTGNGLRPTGRSEAAATPQAARQDERRGGKGCVGRVSTRGWACQ